VTREQFIAFLRALVATLAAGLLLWLFQRIGVHLTVPTISTTPPTT
jgi:hypothetical protein